MLNLIMGEIVDTTIIIFSSLYIEVMILFCSMIFQTGRFSLSDYNLSKQTYGLGTCERKSSSKEFFYSKFN